MNKIRELVKGVCDSLLPLKEELEQITKELAKYRNYELKPIDDNYLEGTYNGKIYEYWDLADPEDFEAGYRDIWLSYFEGEEKEEVNKILNYIEDYWFIFDCLDKAGLDSSEFATEYDYYLSRAWTYISIRIQDASRSS